MARQHWIERHQVARNGVSRSCRQVVGLGAVAGALLAATMISLAAAPAVDADVITSIDGPGVVGAVSAHLLDAAGPDDGGTVDNGGRGGNGAAVTEAKAGLVEVAMAVSPASLVSPAG